MKIAPENKLPLAIIIAGVAIAVSIYLSSTYEYKKAYGVCTWQMLADGSVKKSKLKTDPLWKQFILPDCAFDVMNSTKTYK